MAKATVAALQDLRRPEDVAKIRGKRIHEVLPLPATPPAEEEAPVEEAALAVEVVEQQPAVIEEAPAEEAPAEEEPPVEEPVAETEEPVAETEPAAEAPAEPAAEEKPKRRGLRRKKDDS
jgi:translation initiation factor IF-2